MSSAPQPGVLPVGTFLASLGEGPVWDDRRRCLWFVDIDRQCVHAFDPATVGFATWEVGEAVGAVALCENGDLVLAVRSGFRRMHLDTNNVAAFEPMAQVEADRPRNRMNDGAVDSRGRFWAGTLSEDRQPVAALYRLDPDGAVSCHIEGVTVSNGIDWSPDDRLMYYIDTATRRVDVLDFAVETGTVSGRRPFVAIAPDLGKPDGLVVDAEGGIWVALWAGAAVHRYRPDGQLDVVITVPVQCPTKVAFGGPDYRDLYITSVGPLFQTRTPFRGRAPRRFGG